MVSVVVVVVVLLLVAWLVTAPLRPGAAAQAEAAATSERDDLEARKASKYAEIRDAELDYRTGKLSETDWREIDRGLRAEAVAILHRLDRVE